MEKSKRRLVFHFFITKDWRENKVYDLHFKCLKFYKECWDEVYFALSTEDASDTESLMEVKEKLFKIFSDTKKVEFEIIQNSLYGEVPTFKKEVIDRFGQDDLVFFAHTKGVTDIKKNWLPEDIYKFVCCLYYFTLNDALRKGEEPDLITRYLEIETDFLSFGAFMTQFTYEKHIKNKYEWYYAGTFFWINSKRLEQYITLNKIELPKVTDRYYAENFLGHIFPINEELITTDGRNFCFYKALTYRNKYVYCDIPNYVDTEYAINYTVEDDDTEKESLNNFIKTIEET